MSRPAVKVRRRRCRRSSNPNSASDKSMTAESLRKSGLVADCVMVVLTVLAPKWKSLPGLLSISLARFILCEKCPYFQPAFRFGLARKETEICAEVGDA